MFSLMACSEEKPKESYRYSADTAEGRGERLFKTHCATCHAVEGDRVIVGPSLEGIATRAAEREEGVSAEIYLEESILNPNKFLVEGFVEGSMQQNFADRLTSENVADLVVYLLTLR
jgi:mono/diheme cytochrome c family protein